MSCRVLGSVNIKNGKTERSESNLNAYDNNRAKKFHSDYIESLSYLSLARFLIHTYIHIKYSKCTALFKGNHYYNTSADGLRPYIHRMF